jgi:hypothetical protein
MMNRTKCIKCSLMVVEANNLPLEPIQKAQTSCGQSHACLTKVDSSPRPYMPPKNDPQTSCHREADRSIKSNHRYYLNPQSIWVWVHSQKPMSIGFFCHVMIYEANNTTQHENKLNKTFHKNKKNNAWYPQ